MCGRAKLEGDVSEIKLAFRVPLEYPTPNFAPSWNVAPTDSLPIVRYEPKAGHRTLDLMRWGLVPYWAKDIKIGFSTINAMAETLDIKPVFREAFKRRRCLVPIEAFYEWKKIGPKEKQPYAIALADRSIMGLAGLWETWRSPAQETIRSFTIITTTPNKLCAEVHNRMPVILPPAIWSAWLAEENADEAALKRMLAPYPGERMTMWPVDKRVGNVKNNDPSLIEADFQHRKLSPEGVQLPSSGFSPVVHAGHHDNSCGSAFGATFLPKSVKALDGRSCPVGLVPLPPYG